MTNHHVIQPKPGGRLVVKLPNGDIYEDVWVIHEEERRDLAVLLIKAAGLPTVKLGDSDRVEVGEQVVALGHPKGLEMTFTAGIVSAIRPMPGKGYRFIQHQTPISPGSSGGPLLNMKGEVIGINTFGFEGGQNLNGAVPVNYVKAYLQDPPKVTYEEYARTRGVAPQLAKAPPAPPTGWKAYENGEYRISFDYPPYWKIQHQTGPGFTVFWEWQHQFNVVNGYLKWDADRPVTPKEIDVEKSLEESYRNEEWKHRGHIVSQGRPQGDAYVGYYLISKRDSRDGSETRATGRFFTKRVSYRLDAYCSMRSESPKASDVFKNLSFYCERTFEHIMKSFRTTK